MDYVCAGSEKSAGSEKIKYIFHTHLAVVLHSLTKYVQENQAAYKLHLPQVAPSGFHMNGPAL